MIVKGCRSPGSRKDKMKVSMPTVILDINVFHCTGGEEHYCVDLHGYFALQSFLATGEIGDIFSLATQENGPGLFEQQPSGKSVGDCRKGAGAQAR